MKYEELTEEEIKEIEDKIIQQAEEAWNKAFPNKEASEINKLRYFSRQGYLQNQFMEDVVHGYFKKQGLWHDGKTTLAEHKQDLIEKKKEYGKRIAEIRKAKLQDIDEIIERAKQKKKGLLEIPNKLREKFNIRKKEIIDSLNEELQRIYDTFTQTIKDDLQSTVDHTINRIRERSNKFIENSMGKVEDIYKNIKARVRTQTEEYSAEMEAELSILELKEEDNVVVQQYNDQIKDINVELNELEDIEVPPQEEDLKEYTVNELREIATKMGHKLGTGYITKDNLIGMIQGG